MAKSTDAKKPVSVRLTPDMYAEVEALQTAAKSTQAAVLEELIRLGLAVKKGKPDPNRELLEVVSQLREELAQVKAQLAERPEPESRIQSADAVREAVHELSEDLRQELASQRRKLVEDVAEQTGEHVRPVVDAFKVVWFDVLKRVFKDAKPEELKGLLEKAFKS